MSSPNLQSPWVRGLIKDVPAVLVLIALFVALFFPVLFEGKTFFFRDMLHFGYPFKHFIWESWQQGALPFWNSKIAGGVPFFSLYHPGVFYPPNLIFLLKDFGTAFNIYYLFHHIVLAFSVYRLARYWDLSPEASLGSAVTALLGGYFLSLASLYNHFQTAVWLPLILLSFNRFLNKNKFKDFLITVSLFTFVFLAGSPETCIFIAAILWGYAVLVVPGKSNFTSFFSRTAIFSGVVILSLGLSAVQLVPTRALLKESMRSTGVSFKESSRMSLSPLALSAVILPENHFGFMDTTKVQKGYFLQSCFMGLVPLGLLLAGIFSRVKDRAFWFWGTLFFVGIFFSMGRFNPLYAVVYDWVPLLNLFRFPEKFFFLSAFSLVFLVGLGLDALGSVNAKKRIRPGSAFTAAFVLLVLLGWVAVIEPNREWITGLVTLLILGLILTLASTATRGRVAFKVLAVSLLILELWARNAALLPMVDRSFYEKSPELLAKLEGSKSLYRIYGGRLLDEKELPTANQFPERKTLMASHLALKNLLRPNLGMIYGLNYADGLTGLELKSSWLWTELFIKSPPEKRIRILQRSNVHYWVNDNTSSNFSPGTLEVENFASALPRAFMVNIGRRGRAPQLLNTYYDAAFDPLKEVLLNENANWLRNKNFHGRVEQIEYASNKVRIKTSQNAEGMLVLLDSYFPGWRVEVDGMPGKIFRANYFYRGIKLNVGRHVVEFSYTPEGFHEGLRISFQTLLLLLAGPVFFRFRNLRW
jgi:uncharacterized membrane protein YfhO